MLKSTGTTQLTLLPQLDTRKAALRPKSPRAFSQGQQKNTPRPQRTQQPEKSELLGSVENGENGENSENREHLTHSESPEALKEAKEVKRLKGLENSENLGSLESLGNPDSLPGSAGKAQAWKTDTAASAGTSPRGWNASAPYCHQPSCLKVCCLASAPTKCATATMGGS